MIIALFLVLLTATLLFGAWLLTRPSVGVAADERDESDGADLATDGEERVIEL